VEVLSNNIANGSTVGFKRELALLEARESEAIERGVASRGSQAIEDVGGGVKFNATHTDFSPGTLQLTHVPSDFAIDTPGAFFQVKRGNEQLLTRAGNFHLSADGQLLSTNNDPVLTSDGDPIQLDGALPWRLLPGGMIEQAGDQIELALVRPKSLAELQKVGDNLFRSPGKSVPPVPPEERNIRSGYLELSSVNPVEEMVELITASRAYEANVRVIQQHDTATSGLIGRLLRA
jgi:flagellar basal body rod protein FlgG